MATSRGYRNNNPLNIRRDRTRWQGEVVPSQDRSFKQFKTMEYGYRAAFVLLATYNSRGWNTIERIVSHWAPPNENNTSSYISNVSRMSGIPKDEVLRAKGDKDKYIKIVCAMSRIENGFAADESVVRGGFALQARLS